MREIKSWRSQGKPFLQPMSTNPHLFQVIMGKEDRLFERMQRGCFASTIEAKRQARHEMPVEDGQRGEHRRLRQVEDLAVWT
jgi:hypothetical protein